MSEIINCPECGYAIELDKAMAKKAAEERTRRDGAPKAGGGFQ